MHIWTVRVFIKGDRLRPIKRWAEYLHMSHGQYEGWCYHYTLPDELVADALAQGAQRITAAGIGCGEER